MPATKEETAAAAWCSPEAARLWPARPSRAGEFPLLQAFELAPAPTAAGDFPLLQPHELAPASAAAGVRPLAHGHMLDAAALRAAREEIASALARGSTHVGAIEPAAEKVHLGDFLPAAEPQVKQNQQVRWETASGLVVYAYDDLYRLTAESVTFLGPVLPAKSR